ncbi:HAD family hydrolase [Clavibacter sepedonicus]|uniref:Hydrolase n=1 Tax=Clavibacter sepedonicus TaxID=31964 RepID=B0RC59_CLASE|nr:MULTISPECIES: HAD-IA family hydrolase [Clavibacter]MBD5380844.1 HAD-IA family hydrolase [Clavibacter sp.]OQJ48460.1 haloacid dehalogenase [Clavibacter sepedonicus]OQJ53941.1 haloacid dehalogenase [Clavibacter sepedonicus]UUK65465.1 HAD-IA family hydrolase [Clavibacter sepedonicus]CAQ02945.1 putative hydrolase [Clavibacter sepedonicus]
MTLRLVLLDLDDTLVDHRGAVAEGITAHAAARGLLDAEDATAADRAVGLWRDLEEEHYHRYLAGELDFQGKRRARVRGFLAAMGSPDADDLTDDDAATDAWFAGYLTGYAAAWRTLPGAHDALDEIERRHPGVRLGIVTNGERSQQEPKIAAVGLTARLAPVVCSGDLDFAKPDPRIFHLACAEAGVDPADAVMVGDRLRTDALGAADAGLGGVWLDRGGRSRIVAPAGGDAAVDSRVPGAVLRITALDALAAAVTALSDRPGRGAGA